MGGIFLVYQNYILLHHYTFVKSWTLKYAL